MGIDHIEFRVRSMMSRGGSVIGGLSDRPWGVRLKAGCERQPLDSRRWRGRLPRSWSFPHSTIARIIMPRAWPADGALNTTHAFIDAGPVLASVAFWSGRAGPGSAGRSPCRPKLRHQRQSLPPSRPPRPRSGWPCPRAGCRRGSFRCWQEQGSRSVPSAAPTGRTSRCWASTPKY